jgi:hypothetical protein
VNRAAVHRSRVRSAAVWAALLGSATVVAVGQGSATARLCVVALTVYLLASVVALRADGVVGHR